MGAVHRGRGEEYGRPAAFLPSPHRLGGSSATHSPGQLHGKSGCPHGRDVWEQMVETSETSEPKDRVGPGYQSRLASQARQDRPAADGGKDYVPAGTRHRPIPASEWPMRETDA